VGQFEIEGWVEPTEAQVNEPVTLFVRVSGTGNLTTLPDPTVGAELSLNDWRIYDPQTTTNVGQDGDIISGEKLFERLLVPRTVGDLSIPTFTLVYFDPQAGEYRRIETAPLVVQVTPGEDLGSGPAPNSGVKQDITVLTSDIRHIKAAPPALVTQRTPLLTQPLYWLGWVAPLLAVAGTWVWERRRYRLSSDVAYARAARARRIARTRLAQARKLTQENEDAAYAAVAHALPDYLGDKFNLPSAGLTRDAIRHTLKDQAITPDLIDRSLAGLDWADSGRFAPVAAGRNVEELVAEAEAVITKLEQTIS
jgi:hypothetical protein